MLACVRDLGGEVDVGNVLSSYPSSVPVKIPALIIFFLVSNFMILTPIPTGKHVTYGAFACPPRNLSAEELVRLQLGLNSALF